MTISTHGNRSSQSEVWNVGDPITDEDLSRIARELVDRLQVIASRRPVTDPPPVRVTPVRDDATSERTLSKVGVTRLPTGV